MARKPNLLLAFSLALVTGAASLASAPAAAQVTVTPAAPTTRRVRAALSGEALRAFDRASTLFEDGDFRGARAEFERAHELAGDARLLYNVAVCDKMLRKYTRAIESLQRSLREGGKRLSSEYVARTNETINALAPYVSSVVISADQEGATVLIDGEPVGTTPMNRPVPIEVGEHLISIRKSGYLDVPKRVRVTGGEVASASFALQTATTRSELSVDVQGAPPGTKVMVLVDGVEMGTAPFRSMVEAGPHTIGARAPGFTAAPRRVELEPREALTVSLALERESKLGVLRVRVDDDSDIVELDGRDVSRGDYETKLAAGEHRLRVKRGGAETRALDFVIAENETRSVSLSLERKSGLQTWFWVGGGVLVAAGATVAILLLTRTTEYEGSTPGTLPPRVLPAGISFRGP